MIKITPAVLMLILSSCGRGPGIHPETEVIYSGKREEPDCRVERTYIQVREEDEADEPEWEAHEE